jgi:ethanolamine utilization cobalamin adenosyltransferase
MSGFKTPILTEYALESIGQDVNEIIIPKGTVFTPGARDIIKKRNFIINYN